MPAKLYVGNISSSCTQEQLHSLFARYGRVTELDIVKNFAFVHFDSDEDAQKAVRDLHDSDFMGSKLQVQFSKNQDINRGNKHILKNYEKNAHHKENHYGGDRWPPHEPGRGRVLPERIPVVASPLHRDHRAGLSAPAAYRGKPYDRMPHQVAALPRYPHPAAVQYRPTTARAAAYAEYYKAAALAPAPPIGIASHLATGAHPYAYYDRLMEYKDARVAAAAAAAAAAPISPAAYAAYYQQQQGAPKDPYTSAQIAYERYAGATSRAAAYANAYGVSPMRSAYSQYH